MPFARTAGIIQLDAVTHPMSRIACAPCDRLALSTMDELFSVEVKLSGSRFRWSFASERNWMQTERSSGFDVPLTPAAERASTGPSALYLVQDAPERIPCMCTTPAAFPFHDHVLCSRKLR